MLNIGRPEERATDLSRLSDAELVTQLAAQAKELGIEIDLNYRFLHGSADRAVEEEGKANETGTSVIGPHNTKIE